MKHSVFSSSHTLLDNPCHKLNFWIIDTGATDHMISTVSLFTSIIAIISSHVKLPNGNYATITHIGTIQLSEHLILHDVLHVPSFSFNMISASKLIKSLKSLNCCLIKFLIFRVNTSTIDAILSLLQDALKHLRTFLWDMCILKM
jgi:hypothetical protein